MTDNQRRVVVETACEHGSRQGHYLPHEDHQGPHVLQNRHGPDCPHCFGMTRRILVLDEMVEKGARVLADYDEYDTDRYWYTMVTDAVLRAALGLEEE